MYLNNTHNLVLRFHCNNGRANALVLRYTYVAYIVYMCEVKEF